MIFLRFKNSLAYYSAGVVAVNSKIVGLAPDQKYLDSLDHKHETKYLPKLPKCDINHARDKASIESERTVYVHM
jgi:hypothetical protein